MALPELGVALGVMGLPTAERLVDRLAQIPRAWSAVEWDRRAKQAAHALRRNNVDLPPWLAEAVGWARMEKAVPAGLQLPGVGRGRGEPKHKPEPQALPPTRHVRYRHPRTGEERTAQVIAGGTKGITAVDHDSGERLRLHHGHYAAHDLDEAEADKPTRRRS